MNKWKDLFIGIVVLLLILWGLGVFRSGFVPVAELIPVDGTCPFKIIAYVKIDELSNLRKMADLERMDFKVSYKIPKVEEKIQSLFKMGRVGILKIQMLDEVNIRIER